MNEHILNFSRFLLEGLSPEERKQLGNIGFRPEPDASIYVDEEFLSEEEERRAARDFEIRAGFGKLIWVDSIEVYIPNEYNGRIDIRMSNDDRVVYDLRETNRPGEPGQAPPYYDFSLKINGKIMSHDLDDVLTGRGSIVADVLNFYESYLEKNDLPND